MSTSTSPKVVAIRLTDEQVERIDKLRNPLVPRAAYVKDIIDRALDALERKQPQK